MKRRRRTRETLGVSLFPFLAVLICTLGVLIVLLVLAVKSADVEAANVKAEMGREQERELADLRFQYETRLLQINGLKQVRPDVVKRLSEIRSHRGYLEEEIRQLKRRSQQLAAEMGAADVPLEGADPSSSQELDDLRQRIAIARTQLEEMRAENAKTGPATYTIVPHAGSGGTFRRPIFIECTADALIIQPLEIRLEKSEFVPPLATGNMLDAALLAIRAYWERYDLTGQEGSPYPLLVVRPSGAETYVLARRAMKSWDDEFGYELVESDKQLEFGPDDRQLAAVVNEAIVDARRRQRFLTAQRQTGQGPFAGRNAADSDRYGPGLSASSSLGGFVANSDGKTESHRLAKAAASEHQQTSETNRESAEFDGQTEDERSQTEALVAANAAGESDRQQGPGPSPFQANSLANERGSNWGLPTQTPGATGYVRPIRVVCGAQELEIRSALGTEKTISINGDMRTTIDPLVNEIWRQIESWGISGARSYWKPELRISVLRGRTQFRKTERTVARQRDRRQGGESMSIKQITVGQDSFLDIVANLVGVLIILVVVIRAQAKTAWDASEHDPEIVAAPLEVLQNLSLATDQVRKLELDNAELENRILSESSIVAGLAEARHRVLVQLQLAERKLTEQKIERRRQLDAKQQAEMDRLGKQRELATQLEAIEAESNALSSSRPKSEVIDHFPNPIAKTVFSDEIHFQLRKGKLVYVPMDELVARMRSEWKVKAEKLRRSNRTVETVGPIENFRLQYELQTEAVNSPIQDGRAVQQIVRFNRFSLFPINENLGTEADQALAEGAEFTSRLTRLTPAKTTVSIWVYPDSYSEYNRVKDWLYENGFQVACWPMDFDKRISGGPDGFRTSAQ